MAESTRRLPSWMISSDADEQQPKINTNKGGHRKVSPSSGNARKRKKANRDETAVSQTSPGGNRVSITVQSPGDDRAQVLTVQDLVAIAEECDIGFRIDFPNVPIVPGFVKYVRPAKEVGSEKNLFVKGGCGSRAVSSRIDLQGGVTVNKHNSPTTFCSSMHDSTTEVIPIPVSTTGDPAHDMLHLFLGPLLTKPVNDEKKDVSNRMGLDIDLDAMRDTHNHVGAAAVSPLKEKKKSSLRDKVSLFLD